MKVDQCVWGRENGWIVTPNMGRCAEAQLVLIFGSRATLSDAARVEEVRRACPKAVAVIGCSTAGEIYDTRVLDDSLVVTAVRFDHTQLRAVEAELTGPADSKAAGERLAKALAAPDLAHVFVLSDGLKVNGSELVKGLTGSLPQNVAVTGGLSGDGAKFEQTLVYFNGTAKPGRIVAIGFYGDKLRVGYGSMGGWDTFGPERVVTRSSGNVLYELDGESALALYKKYLGSYAAELPASGLRFPLSVRDKNSDAPVVRTILAVNEQDQSLTFAGDVPEGSIARLMRANFDRLVDGANGAASTSQQAIGKDVAELAILISCVGRKLILQQRTEEEVESVRAVLGERAKMTGFYSYGEISPFTPTAKCELHNQTMTITIFSEAA